MTGLPFLRCASCATRFPKRPRYKHHTCPACGHVMHRNKTQTLRTAASATGRANAAPRRSVTLPKLRFMETEQ